MTICDLCRKPISPGKIKFVEQKDANQHICIDCIKLCLDILKNTAPNDKVVSLNEYKELKEQGLR